LIALWHINPKKALQWMNTIHSFDPNFATLKYSSGFLMGTLQQSYQCKDSQVIGMIYLKNIGEQEGKLDSIINSVLITEAKFVEEHGPHHPKTELSNATTEREKLIRSGTLTPQQADRIFHALYESNINIKLVDYENMLRREFHNVIVSVRDDNSIYHNKYHQEVPQLFHIIPQLSSQSHDKIHLLYDNLPFWDEKYHTVSDRMQKIDPDKYYETWKQLIAMENEHILAKPQTWPFQAPRPKVDVIRKSLNDMKQMNIPTFNEFLISIINHHSPEIRETIQNLMQSR
jgi:hypothetical protein